VLALSHRVSQRGQIVAVEIDNLGLQGLQGRAPSTAVQLLAQFEQPPYQRSNKCRQYIHILEQLTPAIGAFEGVVFIKDSQFSLDFCNLRIKAIKVKIKDNIRIIQ